MRKIPWKCTLPIGHPTEGRSKCAFSYKTNDKVRVEATGEISKELAEKVLRLLVEEFAK